MAPLFYIFTRSPSDWVVHLQPQEILTLQWCCLNRVLWLWMFSLSLYSRETLIIYQFWQFFPIFANTLGSMVSLEILCLSPHEIMNRLVGVPRYRHHKEIFLKCLRLVWHTRIAPTRLEHNLWCWTPWYHFLFQSDQKENHMWLLHHQTTGVFYF